MYSTSLATKGETVFFNALGVAAVAQSPRRKELAIKVAVKIFENMPKSWRLKWVQY